MVKSRPIPFAREMIHAIQNGTKSQTRRVMKNQPPADTLRVIPWLVDEEWQEREPSGLALFIAETPDESAYEYGCKYGKVGDLLWVRETYAHIWTDRERDWHTVYEADGIPSYLPKGETIKWDSSRFMPRVRSRYLLRITDLRAERVDDISEADARAEGIAPNWGGSDLSKWDPEQHGFLPHDVDDDGLSPGFDVYDTPTARECFRHLWDCINKERGFGWESNPWVWVVSFERVTDGATDGQAVNHG